MFDEIAEQAQHALMLDTLEQSATYVRSLKVICAGMFSSFPSESVQQKDAGAAFVHTNDVLAWLEGRIEQIKQYERRTSAQEATEPTHDAGTKAVIH